MANLTVRITQATHQTLRQMADQQGESMQAILAKAIEAYRRQRFMEEFNAGYAALRADPAAWSEVERERALWDSALMDGLDPNEAWREDGDVVFPKPKQRKHRA